MEERALSTVTVVIVMQEMKALFESSHLIVALGILIQVQLMISQRHAFTSTLQTHI